ncbi:type I phosphomannose isomerase catalytic subunit [Alloiococcus sp. CFN-8]|uniref:type I phosphomannose isomerase catalytic subunit n=1 Tax=Alloiococcus sp. CFN-8 TaxID=3416081 RepID=UPI003CE9CFEE
MYPIRFENLYYEKIWGGRDLQEFRDNLPEGNIGESWDIACHKNGTGIVANGNLKGKSFDILIEELGDKLLGKKIDKNEFPLLVKLINSQDKLSVQVHPGDDYAKEYEGSLGKTEAWYVIEAKPGARLIVGTKSCTKDEFKKAITEEKLEAYLNIIEVKKGDSFLIKSGLIHAICEGVIIAEIQQNSDITYRVYDYGRPREIHVEKALEVSQLNLEAINLSDKPLVEYEGYSHGELCRSDYFVIEKLVINNYFGTSNADYFEIITVVDGKGVIKGENYMEALSKGDSYLIPASLGDYQIEGEVVVLKSHPIVY